jgi:hypothetical protein
VWNLFTLLDPLSRALSRAGGDAVAKVSPEHRALFIHHAALIRERTEAVSAAYKGRFLASIVDHSGLNAQVTSPAKGAYLITVNQVLLVMLYLLFLKICNGKAFTDLFECNLAVNLSETDLELLKKRQAEDRVMVLSSIPPSPGWEFPTEPIRVQLAISLAEDKLRLTQSCHQ